MGVIINRPFGGGDLFGRVRAKQLPDGAAEFDCHSWAQFFLKWIVAHPAVTCTIPATDNPRHLEDNLQGGVGRLPDAKMESADDAAILVNNAGFGVWGTFASTDEAKHRAMIEVHVSASVRLCRAVLPGMIARRHGAIVNVSSLAAFVPTPNNVTYSAAKAYLLAFSEGLRAELAPHGVGMSVLIR